MLGMPVLHVRVEVFDLRLHVGNSLVRVFPSLLDGEQRPDRRRVLSLPHLNTGAFLPQPEFVDFGHGGLVVGVAVLDGAIRN